MTPGGHAINGHEFRRLVLLGASNVALGWRAIFRHARIRAGQPIEIWGAFGHGRSYGLQSQVLTRVLPGITECGLWEDLAGEAPAGTAALVTDLGNDLLYGATVEEIVGWLRECLERLQSLQVDISVMRLPMSSLRRLSNARYLLLRSLLFPKCRMPLASVFDQAQELDFAVASLAAHGRIALLTPRPEWYGFDPIHIRRSERADVWSTIIDDCIKSFDIHRPADGILPHCPRLWQLVPQSRRLLGREQYRQQPFRVLEDGSRVHLF